MAAEVAAAVLPALEEQQKTTEPRSGTGSDDAGDGDNGVPSGDSGGAAHQQLAERQLAAIQRYLFHQQGFHTPGYGRSALPERSVVDHPGTWEVAAHANLHEVLITKKGVPAALAIVLADVLRRLLLLVRWRCAVLCCCCAAALWLGCAACCCR